MKHLGVYLLRGLFAFFTVMPVGVASYIGGGLGLMAAPFVKRTKLALANLKRVYPDKLGNWHRTQCAGMWQHLGRLLAELPALKSGELVTRITNVEMAEESRNLPQAIFVSAHVGQWELLVPMAKSLGIGPIFSLYRHMNNQPLDALLKGYRQPAHDELVAKKGDNAISLVRALKQGKNLALLIDQHLTKGDDLPFLGHMAKVNSSAVRLSIKTGVPVVPAFVLRQAGATFKGVICAPIYPPADDTEEEKLRRMTLEVFGVLEKYIHQHPEQYLWLHNRWKGGLKK